MTGNESAFIFLAEDDIDDQELLMDALSARNSHLEVQAVTNGKKAINLLENLTDSHLPCLIVLDYNLPELNGGQILEALSRQGRFADVPKVVWSTSDSETFRQHCLRLGAQAYYVKPSDVRGIDKLAAEMLSYCA